MSKENKKISIILPVYNGEKYIAKSIESIINQTYTNWELIIVNDCSKDNTLKICKSFAAKDKRIKVFTNKINLKLPNSLNAGFNEATGDYYTWTSDDNIFKPEALTTMVSVLDNNQDIAMVYADYSNIDSDNKIIEDVKQKDAEYLMTGDNWCGACFLYRADVAKKVGNYDASLFLAEDYDYWVRIARYGKIKHITDNLYLYRIHGGSLTATRTQEISSQTYKLLEKHFLFMYTQAKKLNLQYQLFDNMMRMQNYNKKFLKLLLIVNKNYKIYLFKIKMLGFIRKIKHKIIK